MTSIYDQDLPQTPANFAPLTPLLYLERAAEVYPDRMAVVHGRGDAVVRHTWAAAAAAWRARWPRAASAGGTRWP